MSRLDPTRCHPGATAILVLLLLLPVAVPAQVGGLGRVVRRAAESETARQVDRIVRSGVRCVFDDLECIDKAKQDGKEVVLTDDGGEVLTDKNGKPVTDPSKVAKGEKPARPGEGAWANWDFVPGDEILVYEDYARDRVGDFPRRFEFIEGSFETIEWQGGRYLRAIAGGALAIPLPRELPERFTVEFSVSITHGNGAVRLTPAPAYYGRQRSYRGSAVSFEYVRAGLRDVNGAGPMSLVPVSSSKDNLVTVRVMGDGDYLKVYYGERRISNIPNAVFPRSDKLYLSVNSADERTPILIGPIRIAGGGLDLYDRLERDGRVATQGILFAHNSDRIRPESTPTLEEIATILREHPELRLAIEGHTDADGADEYNQQLSVRRAAAVKAWLVEEGIDDGRLQAAGFGETRPVADNASPEGKQQNRRVELVRQGS